MITIRVGELAQALGVHRNTIRNWIKSGVLDAKPAAGKRYQVQKEQFIRFAASQGIAMDVLAPWLADAQPAAITPTVDSTGPALTEKNTLPAGKTIGSVLVVGGGIAGIQASLDLADSGYYVYLLEKSPGIDGVMAKLDKTFPTNDCAM